MAKANGQNTKSKLYMVEAVHKTLEPLMKNLTKLLYEYQNHPSNFRNINQSKIEERIVRLIKLETDFNSTSGTIDNINRANRDSITDLEK